MYATSAGVGVEVPVESAGSWSADFGHPAILCCCVESEVVKVCEWVVVDVVRWCLCPYTGIAGVAVSDCDGYSVVVILIGGCINKCRGCAGDALATGVGIRVDVNRVALVIGRGEHPTCAGAVYLTRVCAVPKGELAVVVV